MGSCLKTTFWTPFWIACCSWPQCFVCGSGCAWVSSFWNTLMNGVSLTSAEVKKFFRGWTAPVAVQ